MNRMWSVLTAPCLVETVVPSISGSRSRCTPSRETSPPVRPSRTQILSISSRNTMPLFSTALIASCTSWSLSRSLSDSSLTRSSWESSTLRRRLLVRPPILPKISPIDMAPICAPGMPGISNIGMPPEEDCVSISISLSLSSPARNFLRKESRVAALELAPTRASSTRSSAASCARACTSLRLRSLVCAIATSTRSRMICSTSRPTYPTSVNLVASTLMKGAPASFASRRAISVLPTPVGPIIRIFFGSTSSRREPVSCSRRQRLRSAIETARLASVWPTMKRSSSETISRGEKSVIGPSQVGLVGEQARSTAGQRLDGHIAIGIDADVGGDIERAAHDGLGVLVGVDQGARGRQGVIAAGPDRHHAGFRLQNVAGAGEDQRHVLVGDDHHRLQAPQVTVGAPVLGQFDRGAGQLSRILLELAFQPLEQGKGVGRGAGKTADDISLAELADLFGVGFDDGLADRNLPVAADHHLAALADRQNRGAVPYRRRGL